MKENRMTNMLIMNQMENFGRFIDKNLSFLTSTLIFMKKKNRKMKMNSLHSRSTSSHFKTMTMQTKNTTNKRLWKNLKELKPVKDQKLFH